MISDGTPLIRDRLAALVSDAVARAQTAGYLPSVALPEITIERPAKAEQGDFATNFAMRAQQLLGKAVELGDDDYQGEYIVDLARQILTEEGARFADVPEHQAEEIGAIAARHIMGWIERDLTRARVHFDNWFSEARVIREGDFQRVLDLLKERGLVYEREGAQWLRSQDIGDERDRVLIRSDGRPTYTATDIAYHYDKFLVRKFDRAIDIWGADHQGQVPSMKAIVKNLGVEPERFEIVIYQMVSVLQHGATVQ